MLSIVLSLSLSAFVLAQTERCTEDNLMRECVTADNQVGICMHLPMDFSPDGEIRVACVAQPKFTCGNQNCGSGFHCETIIPESCHNNDRCAMVGCPEDVCPDGQGRRTGPNGECCWCPNTNDDKCAMQPCTADVCPDGKGRRTGPNGECCWCPDASQNDCAMQPCTEDICPDGGPRRVGPNGECCWCPSSSDSPMGVPGASPVDPSCAPVQVCRPDVNVYRCDDGSACNPATHQCVVDEDCRHNGEPGEVGPDGMQHNEACRTTCRPLANCGNDFCGPQQKCVRETECPNLPDGIDPMNLPEDLRDMLGFECRTNSYCQQVQRCGDEECPALHECRSYCVTDDMPHPNQEPGQEPVDPADFMGECRHRVHECVPVALCNGERCPPGHECTPDGCHQIVTPTGCMRHGDECRNEFTGEEGICQFRDENTDLPFPGMLDGVAPDDFRLLICVTEHFKPRCGDDVCDEDEQCVSFEACDMVPGDEPRPGQDEENPMQVGPDGERRCPVFKRCERVFNCGGRLNCDDDERCVARQDESCERREMRDPTDEAMCQVEFSCEPIDRSVCTYFRQPCVRGNREGYCIFNADVQPHDNPMNPDFHPDFVSPEFFTCYVQEQTNRCGNDECASNEECHNSCEDHPERMEGLDGDHACQLYCKPPPANCGNKFCADHEQCIQQRDQDCLRQDGDFPEGNDADFECPVHYSCAPRGCNCPDNMVCSSRTRCVEVDLPGMNADDDEPRRENADDGEDKADYPQRCFEEQVCVPRRTEECNGPGFCSIDGLEGFCSQRNVDQPDDCATVDCAPCPEDLIFRPRHGDCCGCADPNEPQEPEDDEHVFQKGEWYCQLPERRNCGDQQCDDDERCVTVGTECPERDVKEECQNDDLRQQNPELCERPDVHFEPCRLIRECRPRVEQGCSRNGGFCTIDGERGVCEALPQACDDADLRHNNNNNNDNDEERNADGERNGDVDEGPRASLPFCPTEYQCVPLAERNCDVDRDCMLPSGISGKCVVEKFRACVDETFDPDFADEDECPVEEHTVCRPRSANLCDDWCGENGKCVVLEPEEAGLPDDFGAQFEEGDRDAAEGDDADEDIVRRSDEGKIATCVCEQGYFGDRCQKKRDDKECGECPDNGECRGGECWIRLDTGVCKANEAGELIDCLCVADYEGDRCDKKIDEEPNQPKTILDVVFRKDSSVGAAVAVLRELFPDSDYKLVVGKTPDGLVRAKLTTEKEVDDELYAEVKKAASSLLERDDVIEAREFVQEDVVVAAPSSATAVVASMVVMATTIVVALA